MVPEEAISKNNSSVFLPTSLLRVSSSPFDPFGLGSYLMRAPAYYWYEGLVAAALTKKKGATLKCWLTPKSWLTPVENYHDNISVKGNIPTVCFAHIFIW